MNDRDEDENDTSVQTTGGGSSEDTNENSCCEFQNENDDDINAVNHDFPKSRKNKNKERTSHHFSILSHWRTLLFEKNNIFVFVLIPAALITVCAFFGVVSPPTSVDILGSIDINAITSSLLALASGSSNWYIAVLEEYPVFTKSFTTGIIQLLGDYAAQRYEQKQEKEATIIQTEKGYDLRRGLSLFADGLLLSGPLLHYCFEWMEDIWPTGGGDGSMTKPMATLCHVFVNDYIIDSFYIGLSFVFTGVVEGYSLVEVAEIFRKDYGATVRASWLTSLGLIPVEILCFGYLSLSFRVLAMNFVDLLWGAIVSFYSHRSRRENPAQEAKTKSSVAQY